MDGVLLLKTVEFSRCQGLSWNSTVSGRLGGMRSPSANSRSFQPTPDGGALLMQNIRVVKLSVPVRAHHPHLGALESWIRTAGSARSSQRLAAGGASQERTLPG